MLFVQNNGSPIVVQYPSAELEIGSQDFTIEWWQYWLGLGDFPRVFSIGSYDNNDISISISYEGVTYFWNNMTPIELKNSNPPDNIWNHIAIVGSSGNQISFYINGVLQNRLDFNYSFTNNTLALTIGNENNSTIPTSNNFTGKLTNFRWVVGSQVYTSNFTPPTSPLTNIPGTKLLLLSTDEANVIKDSSNYNNTPTNIGVVYSSDNPF
jgi:hypothetical protein